MIDNYGMDYLNFLVIFTLCSCIFILFVYYKTTVRKEKQEQESTSNKPQKSNQPKTKTDEVMDTLEWMLTTGIIDNQTYNQLVTKCMPFL